MKNLKKHFPNILTISRFFFGGLMLVSSLFKSHVFFLLFYIFALITDIADGFFARKMKKTSDLGKKLDILADNFIILCLIVSFFLLKKNIMFSYRYHIFFLFGYYSFVQIISIIFAKKIIFMRTYAANLAAILFPFLIILILLFESTILIYPYILIMVYSLSEKLILNLAEEDKKTIFHLTSLGLKIFFFLTFILLTIVLFLVVNTEKPVFACFEDDYCISLEVRDSEEERALGLMFRERLLENRGMLFIFDQNVSFPFWMKNMKISIDIIFINSDKKIISISENALPCNKPDEECELYSSSEDYLYVIETISGFSEKHNLEKGQEVRFSPKTFP